MASNQQDRSLSRRRKYQTDATNHTQDDVTQHSTFGSHTHRPSRVTSFGPALGHTTAQFSSTTHSESPSGEEIDSDREDTFHELPGGPAAGAASADKTADANRDTPPTHLTTPPATVSPVKQGKQPSRADDRNRHATLVPQQEYFKLVDESVEPPVTLAVNSIEDLIQSVTCMPRTWISALCNMTSMYQELQEEHEHLKASNTVVEGQCAFHKNRANSAELDNEDLKATNHDLKSKLDIRGKTLKIAQANADRLTSVRSLRNDWRTKAEKAQSEVITVTAELTKSKAEVLDLKARAPGLQSRHSARRPSADSDREPLGDQPEHHSGGHKPQQPGLYDQSHGDKWRDALDQRAEDLAQYGSRRILARGTELQPTPRYEDKKYPDVEKFYGDKEVWESWQLHLYTKFYKSWSLFPNETDKIVYIRDHCKKLAWNIIRARSKASTHNPYLTAKEMMTDLEKAFGEKNSLDKAARKFYNPKFRMKSRESFDEFHVRFTIAGSDLDLSPEMMLVHLKQKVAKHLKNHVPSKKLNYDDLVEWYRDVDLELGEDNYAESNREPRKTTRWNTNKERSRSGGYRRRGRSGSRGSPRRPKQSATNKDNAPNGRYRAATFGKDLLQKMKKEDLCFKCLKPGHRPNDSDAPCKDKKPITREQAEVMLKAFDIGYDADAESETLLTDFDDSSDSDSESEN